MKSIHLKIALLLTTLIVCFGLAEIGIRLAGEFDTADNFVFKNRVIRPYNLPIKQVAKAVAQLQESTDSILIYDKYLGWKPRPNSISRNGLYQFNSQGLRSPVVAYSARPDSGVLRVALFGDSFTHSDDVPYEDSLGAILEQGLKAAGVRAEVLNFGVGGYGIDQAMLRFATEGKNFAPDLVVLGFQPEDLKRNLNILRPLYDPRTRLPLAKPRFIFEKDGISLINVPVLPPEKVAPTLANLAAWDLLPYEHFYDPDDYRSVWWRHSKLLATLVDLRSGQDDPWLLKRILYRDQSEEQRLGWAEIQAFAGDAKQANARFMVVHLPTVGDLDLRRRLGRWPYQTFLDALCEQYPVADPSAKLLAEMEQNGVARVFAGHYTAQGNHLVAASLQALIIELFPEECRYPFLNN